MISHQLVKSYRYIETILFPPNSRPYGLTFSQWIVEWWRWLLSIPKESNPAFDMSGSHVSEKQVNPNVWFLTGTFGGSVVRRCKIPLGKAILIPVINYECSFAEEQRVTTESELKLKCEKEIDDIKNLYFGIDELFLRDLSAYRTRSPLFDVDLGKNNILGVPECTTKMISDGYWIFVKPLRIGSHKLISSGSCRSGRIMIGTTYDLCVQ